MSLLFVLRRRAVVLLHTLSQARQPSPPAPTRRLLELLIRPGVGRSGVGNPSCGRFVLKPAAEKAFASPANSSAPQSLQSGSI